MQKYKGKGASSGVAIGKITVVSLKDNTVIRRRISDISEETERFYKALDTAKAQLSELYERSIESIGEEQAQIFEIHKMMLDDNDYISSVISTIETQMVNAEYAVALSADDFAAMFAAMEDPYMKAREADVRDVSNRVIAILLNKESEDVQGDSPAQIICAGDLHPSETLNLDKDKIAAFICAYGAVNSHTSILASSMGIPAVIGAGEDFLSQIRGGEVAIVDGTTGEIIVSPDDTALEEAEKKISKANAEKKRTLELIEKLRGTPDITKDGIKIDVFANIGRIDEISAALKCDCSGIGLFRSEFLFLEKGGYPTEDEQFSVYKTLLRSMGTKKVIIRTLDIGADKDADYFCLDKEENPALGLRGIRVSFSRPELFKTQLRALFRASKYGNLGIMFPMITSEWEVREIIKICVDIKAELLSEKIEINKKTELGIMIETPAAALISDKLALLVDFFSIGTNDLTQYTLACDRQNPKIEKFVNSHHDAVIRLIELTVKNAHDNGKWVGICGELAADLSLTEKFLTLRVDELSVSPIHAPELKSHIRNLDLSPQKRG